MTSHSDLLPSYAPGLAARRLASDAAPLAVPSHEDDEGAVLFVDISGFTPLTERMARRGAPGAEELGQKLNRFFGHVVDTITRHGGCVIDFAGDAVFALWRRGDAPLDDAALRATACALALQQELADGHEDVPLAIKTSVGAGSVRVLFVGRDKHYCLVGGAAHAQVIATEKHTEPGQVAVSADVRFLLGDALETEELADGCALVRAARAPAPEPLAPLADVDDQALRDWVPATVLDRLDAGQGAWLAEFRRVTTVFVSVLGLSVEDDDVAARLHDVVEEVQGVADRFKGSISQLVIDDKGTIFLVAFGLPPRGHEDDAARGVRAALAIEDAVAELGLRSAIGITTGRVFCAPLGGDERRKYQVQADVVNLAARLMQAALDDVLCDAATARELDGAYETLDPIHVKGKAAPVGIFRPFEHDAATPPRASGELPLLGRDEERARLASWVDALVGGDGLVAVIEGEAGIGKSRLLQELADRAQQADCRLLYGAASAIEEGTAWFAWRGVFEQLFELDDVPPTAGARRRHVTRRLRAHAGRLALAPLLDAVLLVDLPQTAETEALAGKERADRTRDLLLELLRDAAREHPTVLIVEDAHWLDSASWALVQRVAREVPELLLAVASRPPVDAGAGARLSELSDVADDHLQLRPMSRDATVDLVARRLGATELAPDLAALIRERAEGHPFFSEELAFALRDAGMLRTDDGRASLTHDVAEARAQLPDTVQGVVTSRLDALAPAQQLVLKVASVIGRVFSLDALRGSWPEDAAAAEYVTTLVELEALDLVSVERAAPELTYRFKHGIIRDVTYDGMLYAQRRQVHAAVARYLEAQGDDDRDKRLPALAHHYKQAAGERAEDPALTRKAAHYARRAGEQALFGGAFHEARDFLEDALAAQRALPAGERAPSDELSILLLLGTATFTTHGYGADETFAAYERAWEVARVHGSDEERFRVLFGRWIARHFQNADDALAVGEEMLALARATGEEELVLQAHHGMWTTLMQLPDYTRSLDHLEAGLELYREEWHARHCALYGGHDPGACGQRALALTRWVMGRADAAREAAGRAQAWSQRHSYTLGTTLLAAAFVARQRGDVDEADRLARELLDLARETALPGFVPWAETFRAWAVGRRGDLDEGIARFEALAPELGYLDAGYMGMLLDLYQRARRPEPGLALVDELFAALSARRERNFEAEVYRYRAELLLCGDGGRAAARDETVARARADLARASSLAAAQGALAFELRAALSLALLEAERGDEERARAVLRPVYERFTEGFDTEDLTLARELLSS